MPSARAPALILLPAETFAKRHSDPKRRSDPNCPYPVIPAVSPYLIRPAISSYPVIPAVFSGNPREGHSTPAATREHLAEGKRPWIPVYTGMTWEEKGMTWAKRGMTWAERGKGGVRRG